jgi:chaperonin GroEL
MSKFLVYGAENRRRLMDGADTFARAVCVTYGPKGRVVMLNRAAGLMATKDGVTVAREVEVHDPVGQLACQALKNACIEVNNAAGDGTTSTACIAAHILREGVRVCAGDLNPIFVSRGVQAAAKAAVEILRVMAHPITLQEHLERVALVASNGDTDVASKMAEAVMAVGKRGTVSIEDGQRIETTLVFRDGMMLDRGAASDVFLKKKLERVLEAPLVAVVAAHLTAAEDVLDMCEEATTYGGHPLLLFCDGISGEALKTLILNDASTDHNFEFVAVLAPGNFEAKKAYLGDIAALAGAQLVDAAQGIEAQTLANLYLAMENDLEIIPVLNKIDLPSADVERVSEEVMNLLGCKREDIIPVSAKTGINVEAILDAVIARIPEPKKLSRASELLVHESMDNEAGVTKALIFDSQYDPYKGVVVYLKLFSGEIKK